MVTRDVSADLSDQSGSSVLTCVWCVGLLGTEFGTIIDEILPPRPKWSFFSACTGSNLIRPANNPFRCCYGGA